MYFNLTESYTQGLESRFSWKYAHFSATAGLALTGRYNYLYETAGEEIDAFSYAPNAHVQIQHTWKKAGIHTAVFYKYTGAIQGFFQDGNGLILPTRIGDYHLLDANLRRRFWQERIDLTLGVKNLLNVRNVPLSGSSGAAHSGGSSSPRALGRNLFFNLQFYFSKK